MKLLTRSEFRRNGRGEVWFKCRRCKAEGLPHFTSHSASIDRDNHKCSETA